MKLRMGWRHVLVAVSVVICVAVTGLGLIGPAAGPERITSYDVVATMNPDRTVSVREVIDWDFGIALDKHGIFRDIPTDAGVPEQVRVWSPDAPDEAVASRKGADVSIRIGDPDTLVRGRKRYVISYVLPALVEGDRFAFDAIGTAWPVPIDDVTIALRGTELDDPRCFLGESGSTDRCPLRPTEGGYRTEIDHLDAHEAVTLEGRVLSPPATEEPRVVDAVSADPAGTALPPFAPRDGTVAARWAAIVAVLGAAVGLAAYGWSRQTGRNQVAVGGATEAAFADLSAPDSGGRTRLVADQDMADLAGLEFTPPPGVQPWQGAVVLRESVDGGTVGSWFSSQAAHEIVTFHTVGGTVSMAAGPRAAEADPETAAVLNKAMANRPAVSLGSYDPLFAAGWADARSILVRWARTSGVFRHRPPSSASGAAGFGLAVGILCGIGIPILLALGFTIGLQTATAAIVVAVLVPGAIGLAVYRRLVRSLSTSGSAIWLRTESFRRFLHESEARHVEWAWQNGLLREYSAWAVALGEARAWDRALGASAVPPAEVDVTHSVLAPSLHASSFSSSHTAPSSSGSGGGGGGAGGGGGGGGGGSW